MMPPEPRCLFFVFFLIAAMRLAAAELPVPIARFSFNNGSTRDEIGGQVAKLVGASPATDRFGNRDHAVFLADNLHSYVNLGSYKALKPTVGSISLWVNIEHNAWSGRGTVINPILLTKLTSYDDFYEAYAVYYDPAGEKFSAVSTLDSTRLINLYSTLPIRKNNWYHLVFTYDFDSAHFYMDGKLQARFPKQYDTRFLGSDSVLIGSTGNKKNMRFLKGNVDDVEFYDRVLGPEEVAELYHAPDPNEESLIRQWVVGAGIFLLLLVLAYLLIRYRIRKGIAKERARLELHNKLLKTELRVNRVSMNPHFLFNSLNALHSFILAGDNDLAAGYLIKFSKLIRKTLDSNMYDFIPLELEIELLERYLDIEKMRFEEDIYYRIHLDPSLAPAAIHIPLMMLQPFVENAIWHGLLNKEGEKRIDISFTLIRPDYIYCKIEDNGVGRRQQKSSTHEKRSLATTFVMQRLELINRIHGLQCRLSIEDKPESRGTIVHIYLPILNR